MQFLVITSTLLSIILGTLTGLKLAFVAMNTRKLPEAAFAVRMLAMGALAYPMMIIARAPCSSTVPLRCS